MFISCLFMFSMGLTAYFFMKSYVLMLLIIMEFISISVLMLLLGIFSVFLYDVMMIIYFLIVLVCEAVMGLVILTLLIRIQGSDYFKVSSIMLC